MSATRSFANLGNGGYQANAYLLDLTYSATSRTVTGKVTMAAKATQDLSRFNLDSAYLDIRAVRVNKQTTAFGLSSEELVVVPVKPLRNGSHFVVEVDYAVDPRQVPPSPIGGWVPTEQGFAVAPQPSGAHTIFPCNDHPSDKAHFTFRITAPAGTSGVATGRMVNERTNADGSTTTTWVSRHPIATEIFQATVDDYTVVEHGLVDGVRLRDVVPTERVEALRPALELTPGQLDWIKRHLGEFPLEAYGLLPVDPSRSTARKEPPIADRTTAHCGKTEHGRTRASASTTTRTPSTSPAWKRRPSRSTSRTTSCRRSLRSRRT